MSAKGDVARKPIEPLLQVAALSESEAGPTRPAWMSSATQIS